MATIVVLKNKETGKTKSMYSVDARRILEQDPTWEFHKRLSRTAKMVESGVAAQTAEGEGNKAVEFHGDSVAQEEARKAVEPAPADPVAADATPVTETEKKDIPQAPRGSRGGGKQEPAKAKSEDG